MNYKLGEDLALCYFVNPHTPGMPHFSEVEENAEAYESPDNEFIAVNIDSFIFVVDSEEQSINRIKEYSVVPTPSQNELKDTKTSIRELCAQFGSSTIRNALRRNERLVINREEKYEFDAQENVELNSGLINELFPFCESAVSDLEVYPLEGLLCIDDAIYAAAHARTLSPKYTGFDQKTIDEYDADSPAVVQIRVPLEEEYLSLIEDLKPDLESPALAVLVNVCKALNEGEFSSHLHPQIQQKFKGTLDPRKARAYASLLALHCCSNNCELITLCKCLRTTEGTLTEILHTIGVHCTNGIASLNCARFKIEDASRKGQRQRARE